MAERNEKGHFVKGNQVSKNHGRPSPFKDARRPVREEVIKGIQIEYVPIKSIRPSDYNPRDISFEELEGLAKSIQRFGPVEPIVFNSRTGNIVGGHQRYKVFDHLGYQEVPIVRVDLSLMEEKALNLALNNHAIQGKFNPEMVHTLIEEIRLELPELEKDLRLDVLEKDLKIALPDVEKIAPVEGEDDIPEVKEEPIVKKGDLFILGSHRLLCGDSTMIDDVERLMSEEKADMVFTDPPYGISEKTDRVENVKTFKNQGMAKKGKYNPIIGDDSIQTAVDVFNLLDGLGIKKIIYWGGNYYAHELPSSPCWLVWDKRVEENQRDINSDCELAYIKHPSKESVRIFRHLWKGMIKGSEHGQARCHPTQKPIALAEYCIEEYLSDGEENVLDLFGGSGSTLIACEKTNRKCFMMEIDPHYCQVIIERYLKFTGREDVYLIDGENKIPWKELMTDRASPNNTENRP